MHELLCVNRFIMSHNTRSVYNFYTFLLHNNPFPVWTPVPPSQWGLFCIFFSNWVVLIPEHPIQIFLLNIALLRSPIWGIFHYQNNRNSSHLIVWCRVQYLKYFSRCFYFRHISRAEGEWNIGNNKNEKSISILLDASHAITGLSWNNFTLAWDKNYVKQVFKYFHFRHRKSISTKNFFSNF